MIESRIDVDLIDAARSGDEAAWALLYSDLAPAVAGYLRSRRTPDVDDVLGDVFLDVARRIGSFDGTAESFRSWVFVIAHSKMVDSFRRAGRRVDEPLDDTVDQADPVDTEDRALGSLGSDRVLSIVEGLSDDQRTIVLLRVFGDLTMAEIAEATGKSRTAVKVAHFRAMKALRDRLEDGM